MRVVALTSVTRRRPLQVEATGFRAGATVLVILLLLCPVPPAPATQPSVQDPVADRPATHNQPQEIDESGSASTGDLEKPGAAGTVIVEGQVTNQGGAGETLVLVTVHRKRVDGTKGELLASATTDKMGDFKLTSREKINAEVIVTFSKPNYEDVVRQVEIGTEEFPPFLAEQLEGKLEIRGRVADGISHRPIADASITLQTPHQDLRTKSGVDGRFVLEHVSPGNGNLLVEAKGYGRERVVVADVAKTEDLTVDLKPERIVSIKLVDEQGKPIPRANVEVFDKHSDDFHSYVTAADGSVTMHGIHFESDTLAIRLTEQDHVSSSGLDREVLLPWDKSESQHVLIMPRAGRISGTIRDADSGAPLNGARVMTGEQSGNFSPRDWADYRGEYQISGVRPGTTAVTVHLSSFAPEVKTVEVKAMETTKLDFRLRPGTFLKGQVVDAEGKPVGGATVDATRWRGLATLDLRAMTGGDGRFLIESTPHDEFEITVYARNAGRVTTVVKAEENETVRIALPRVAASAGSDGASAVKKGDNAPDVSMTTIKGEHLRLADLRHKTVLLDFWATWCGPCVAELPHLRAVYEKFSSRKDFELISISLDGDERALRRFVKKHKMSWHQVFGEDGGAQAVADKFGVVGLPALFLIGPGGAIMSAGMRSDEIMSSVESALKDRPPS